MRMNSKLVASSSCLFCAGCALPVPLPSEQTVSIPAIIKKVECEINDVTVAYLAKSHAVGKTDYDWLQKFAAGISLIMDLNEEGGPNAGYAFDNPIVAGLVKVTLGVTANEKAHRIADVDVKFKIPDLLAAKLPCAKWDGAQEGYFFTNDTGVSEWMTHILDSFASLDTEPEKFSHSLDFTLNGSFEGKSAWTFIRQLRSVGLKLSKSNQYTLKVAFARIPPKGNQIVDIGNLNELARIIGKPATGDGKQAKPSPRYHYNYRPTPPIQHTPGKLPPVDPLTRQLLDQQLLNLELRSVLPNR